MNNQAVVKSFLDGKTAKSGNLTVTEHGRPGDCQMFCLWSYKLLIGVYLVPDRPGNPGVVNVISREASPSVTTTRHIGMLRTAINMRPGDSIILGHVAENICPFCSLFD